jgi:hypothetical protein
MFRTLNRRLFFAAVLLIASSPCLVGAEDSRGRLPDGRAFRTDEQGNQLVDYIAELEVNAEALQRRVHGLEDELADKQRIIERLGRGEVGAAALNGRMVERTIAGDETAGGSAVARAALAVVDAPPQTDASCRVEMERVAAQLSAARDENSALRNAADAAQREARAALSTAEFEKRLRSEGEARIAAVSAEYAAHRDKPVRDCDAEVATVLRSTRGESARVETHLREQLAALRIEHAQAINDSRERYATQVENALAQVTALEGEIEKARSEVVTLRSALSATEAKLTEAKVGLDQANIRLATATVAAQARPAQPVVVAATQPVEARSVYAVRQSVSSDAARSRRAVVESLRGSMLGELQRVRSVVATRDARFAASEERADRQVRFAPSRLVSSNQRTLDDIAASIRAADQVHQLTALRTDLAEIRALAQGDIDLLRRTGRG